MANLALINNHNGEFKQYEPLIGEEIALVMNRMLREDEALEGVPAYLFDIVFHDGTRVGQIDLRLGDSEPLVTYGGQIGYGIDKKYRGNRYAEKACLLIRRVAIDQGFDVLWITCNPDNIGSIRTCERIGARFVEQVAIPKGTELWRRGDREKLRYQWQLVT